MSRALILIVMAGALILLVAPFVASSLAVDRKGIPITGRVQSKSETVHFRYQAWSRVTEVTVEYHPPETGGVSFFGKELTTAEYDALHKGDSVPLRYLRPEDTPNLPLSKILREIHALPMVRMADQDTYSRFRHAFPPGVRNGIAVVAVMILILFWWRNKWAIAAFVVLGLAYVMIYDFPVPTPAPAKDVRHAAGRIKSIDRISKFFQGRRSRGFDAVQPIQIVGVEFVPDGRNEPVVAVDLIDEGSAGGLKEKATVPVTYEAASPRTAWVEGATRTFVGRNVRGMAWQAALALGILAGFFFFSIWIGGAFKRLVARR